jgi:diguanylate cyclase (GGDEF)-like protein
MSGLVVGLNMQMEMMAGRSRSEMIGHRLEEFFIDHDPSVTMLNKVIRNTMTENHVIMIRNEEGKETVITCNASLLCDSDGRPAGMLVDARDALQLKGVERYILDIAYHDALTRLANRNLLNIRLEQAMAMSKRSNRYGALIFLDLDKFKMLNDSYGHNVGDVLLTMVAERITECVREVDFVARYGGDEFVVIIGDLYADKDESMKQSMVVARKILATLGRPYLLETVTDIGEKLMVSHRCAPSIGVALFLNHQVPISEVIRWADVAMYVAKQDGGDTIRIYDPDTNQVHQQD